ncbi:MAG: hypothetical protein BroJett040_25090 [Oligoflexia bacterium]|nr:MAG: hypothetical protein BroJett040_25090 [Oligoflexia bacterium]
MRYLKRRRSVKSGRRAQWECEFLERKFCPIDPEEMRQRLAECLETLLYSKSQLTEEFAFSSDSLSSQNSKPRFNHKRKAS